MLCSVTYQWVCDGGNKHRSSNCFRNSGAGDSAHNQTKYSGESNILCQCILLCQKKVNASHHKQCVTNCCNSSDNGQCENISGNYFFYGKP